MSNAFSFKPFMEGVFVIQRFLYEDSDNDFIIFQIYTNNIFQINKY